MNLKLCITIGTAAIGWMSSGGDIQAVEQQDLGSSGPFEIAQSPGTGGPVSSGAPGGGEGSGMPSGQTERGLPSTNNMDTMGKAESGRMDMGGRQPGIERGMQNDLGKGGLPGPSAGSTMGGSGTNSFGSTSGSGSAGMGGSSGGMSGMGGSAGGGTSSGGGR
jgi:hypothetical protein